MPEARLFREGLWIAGGHAAAAAAALVGVRLTTELAPASLYGAFVLLNGGLALLQGVLLQPVAQAAFRYYPEYALLGSSVALRAHLAHVFGRRWAWSAVGFALVCVGDAVTLRVLSAASWLLLAGAVGLEAWKATEIVLRSAARRQAAYAALYGVEGIGRAAGVVVAAWTLGPSLESLLFGQCVGVLSVLMLFAIFDRRDATGNLPNDDARAIAGGMSRFAAPLLWSPVVGWVSGLAGRYIVGGMLGLGPAGIYVAASSLVSRPMLMVGSVTDATLRQVLYWAAARHDNGRLYTVLAAWVVVNLLAGGLLTALLLMLSGPIMKVLLAADYRADATILLPWLAVGYVLMLLGQAVERFLYAWGRTRAVIGIQSASAACAVLAGTVAVWWYGLLGAAIAVPVHFAIQLIFTLLVTLRISRTSP